MSCTCSPSLFIRWSRDLYLIYMTLKGTKHRKSVEPLCVWKTMSPHSCSPVPGTVADAVENALAVVGFEHQTPFLATELIFHLTARVHCSQLSYFWSPRSRTPSPHPAPAVILLGSLQLVTICLKYRRAGTLCLKMSHDCRVGGFKVSLEWADSGKAEPLFLLGSV